jgi:phage gpG-like protein
VAAPETRTAASAASSPTRPTQPQTRSPNSSSTQPPRSPAPFRRPSPTHPATTLTHYAIIHKLEQLETEQFDSEGARGSGGWAPLAPATVAEKARRGLDPRILHATGRLRASLTARGGDAIRESHPDEMRFGTDVPYAAFHQRGTARMPRRRGIELPATDRHMIFVQTIHRFLVTGQTPSL